MTGYLAVIVLALLLSGAGYLLYSPRVSDEKRIHRTGYPRRNGADTEAALAKVLVLTAAVGGGHEAAGQTIRAELEKAGRSVAMADGLHEISRSLSWFLNRVYCNQARNKPGSLAAVFAVTSRRAGAAAVRFTTSSLFANRLLKVISEEKPGLIISTYPLVTAALGHLRSRGKLQIPAVAVIADYGVHPLWVSPSADLHLVVSQRSAELTEYSGGKAAVIRMPVAPAFYSAPARGEARRILGLPNEAFVVLVVGGAWGIGDLGGAARCAAESGAYTIVVTGNNTQLEARLEESLGSRDNVRILGWTQDMPVLMAAADCLVQNAGGMTCTEAIEVGLPIVIFDPIPGHGELNAVVMEQVGAALQVNSPEELQTLLKSAVKRETSLPAPTQEAGAPAVSTVLDPLAAGSDVPGTARPRRVSRLRPRPVLASVSLLAFLSWLAFAPAGVAVAAKGFRADVPGYDPSPGEVSLGIRVTDPATAAAVESGIRRERMPATVFANARASEGLRPATELTFGVAEEPGPEGSYLPWRAKSQARAAASEIQLNTGAPPGYFLPATRTNLAAYAEAPSHTRLVMPGKTGGTPSPGLMLVDTSGLNPEAARQKLARAFQEIRDRDLECVPLAEL